MEDFTPGASSPWPHPSEDPRYLAWLRARENFEEQDENGTDLSLIRSNLRLTPLERIRRGDRELKQHYRIQETFHRIPNP